MQPSSLNFLELQIFCIQAQSLVGGRIQEVHSSQKGMGFFVWAPEGAGRWLFFDMTPAKPFPVFFAGKKFPMAKAVKPVALFFKSHGLGQVIEKIECRQETGRILFIETRDLFLEVRLFPHGQNLIVRFLKEEKSISWNPVKDLPPMSSLLDLTQMKERDLNQLQSFWWSPNGDGTKKNQSSKVDVQNDVLKRISKKKKALVKMSERLDELKSNDWFQLGQYLQEKQTLEVPEVWQNRIKKDQSLSFNIGNCFEKHKSQKKKAEGTEERLQILRQEISDLQNQLDRGEVPKSPALVSKGLLSQAQAKGRKLVLENGIEAVIGKSAKDNLSILRRAKSWFLWLHIKDRPGAYGIISRGRGQGVSDEQLQQVCRWMLKESRIFAEGKVEFLLAECRYVQPIKGDKLGRVTHRQSRVLTVSS